MKHVMQMNPTAGHGKPYQPGERGRVVGTSDYWEVEFPLQLDGVDNIQQVYIVFYIIPDGPQSLVLVNPLEGVNELIDRISEKEEYLYAFRKEWPLFDGLIVDDMQLMKVISKRPGLVYVQDPDDKLIKWMVARQVKVPKNAVDRPSEFEINVVNSLLKPALGLSVEFEDALYRVQLGLVKGTYPYPKNKNDQLFEKIKVLGDIADYIPDVYKHIFR